MPPVHISIPDTNQTVLRPIVFSLIEELNQITKIKISSQDIFFFEETQRASQVGSMLDDPIALPRLESEKYLYVTVEHSYDKQQLLTNTVHQHNHQPIFSDSDLNVYLSPIYGTSNLTLTYNFQTTSKNEAIRWCKEMRVKVSERRDYNLHKFNYHYTIPNQALDLLSEIYTLRETVEGYGETLAQYLVSHFTPRLKVIGDIANKCAALSIQETQTEIYGWFEMDDLPDKWERDEATGAFLVKFSYKLDYEEIDALMIRYPFMVHNQLLPDKYINYLDRSKDQGNVSLRYSLSQRALASFRPGTVTYQDDKKIQYATSPPFDDFIPREKIKGLWPLFIGACTLALPDRKTLLSLRDLGDYVIDQKVLAFLLESEWPYLTQLYKSIFHVCYYKDYRANLLETALTSDDHLTIKAPSDLNPRSIYRVRLSIVYDLSLLDPAALKRLNKWPEIIKIILPVIDDIIKIGDSTVPPWIVIDPNNPKNKDPDPSTIDDPIIVKGRPDLWPKVRVTQEYASIIAHKNP